VLVRILSTFPILEVLIRHLYWKSLAFNRLVNYMQRIRSKPREDRAAIAPSILESKLFELGVRHGDTLIVHSAFSELKRFNMTPDEVIDLLLKAIGVEGNLIMPAIPLFKAQPEPFHRFDLANYKCIPVYDLKKTRVWTGLLPQTLLRRPGALRSRNPLNSMVVFGRDSKALIDYEYFDEESLACGYGSVLANSLKYNSKILFLGVDEVHSMTMIHVAEDLYPADWPVENWYWKRKFEIVDGDFHRVMELRERNPKWALFYAERRFSSDLLSSGVLKRLDLEGFNMSICESNLLVGFLRSKNNKAYPYFVPGFKLRRGV